MPSDGEVDDEVDINQRMFKAAHNGQESIVRQMLSRELMTMSQHWGLWLLEVMKPL